MKKLIEAPNLREKREEIPLPKETELNVKNFSALISELLSAKKRLDKFDTEMQGAYDVRSKVQDLRSKIDSLTQRLETLSDRVDEKPDITDNLFNLQEDISKLYGEIDKFPAIQASIEAVSKRIEPFLVKESVFSDALTRSHEQGSDTSLDKQEQDLDMGNHKIVNVEGSEVANKEYVDRSIGSMAVSGRGGGGIQKSGTPDANEYARWTKRGQLEGRSKAEVKSDLDLEDTDVIKHSLATAVSDFLVASGAGVFVKKTLTEVKTLLNWAADIATHAALTATHGVAGTIAGIADITSAITTHAGLTDPHTGYQKESEKGAVSGYASLDASQKVVEQPASISDHLEASPTNGLATKAPDSNWAFDHDAKAATASVQGHATATQITKLDGIEAAATKYPDTGEQAFLDADHSKLDGIAAGATAYTDALAVDAVEAAGLIMADTKNIEIDATPAASHTANGIIVTMTAGTALVFGDACYVGTDGKMEKALADDAAITIPATHLCIATIAENAAGLFLLVGWAHDDSWAFDVGLSVYLSKDTAGLITKTMPLKVTGNQVQVLGTCLVADTILWYPSSVVVEYA